MPVCLFRSLFGAIIAAGEASPQNRKSPAVPEEEDFSEVLSEP